MRSMKNWMLGAAVLAGAAGVASIPAQAAQFGIYVQGPAAYVPPSPGPGYVWSAGYMYDGYWVPGRWDFVGYGYRDGFMGRDFDRDDRGRYFDRDLDWNRDRYRDRDWDRDRDRYHDRFRR
ncbi:MAG TPA: hypothetical protein VGT08_21480 [Terracidiphilus sp.]|nr:hypothetical protein [Terracidiphilus sp.]